MIRGFTGLTIAVLLFSLVRSEVISIGERVEVNSDQLRLGDIAQIRPADAETAKVPIGYAPYPGHYRWITRSDIENYLHKWGLDQKVEIQMNERVLITRQSQQVDRTRIEEKVQEFLSSLNPELKISVRQIQIPEDLFLPVGPVELSIDPPASVARLSGLSLKVDFYLGGDRLKSQWIRLDAVAEAPVVVLKREVLYGQALRRSDLGVEVRQFDRLEGVFTNLDDVVGSVAKRSLPEGEVVTKKDLKEAVLVNRGDVVTLLARGSAFVVNTLGRSRDSGSKGDTVVIENLDSKQLVHATVIGSKTVEVLIAGGTR